MSRKWTSMTVWLAAVLLFGSVVTACSGNNGGAKATGGTGNESGQPAATDGKPDTAKKVELVWYLLGDPHADTEKVVAEWNKMLERDLNATVKLNFTIWTDWQTKYNLLLTSGEKIDMIFASTWADYYRFANQGAFLPLDDLLPKYAPETWKRVPEQDWEEARVKGNIYAVPSTYPEYTPDGLVYREDWRKELNLPSITDLETLEQYLDGVKKAKPEVTPINGKAWNEAYTLFKAYHGYEHIGGDSGVVVARSYDNPRDIIAYPFTDEFEAWVKRMKTWADKGFWTSDSLSSQKEAGDAIRAGNGAVYWRNAPGAGGFIMDMKRSMPEVELAYFPFTVFHNYVMPSLSVQNAMAIPKSAANPERSLMVLDKLRYDQKYYDLMTYGIEGVHYSIGEDGKSLVTPPAGVEAGPDFAKYGIASWGWRIEDNEREPRAAGWPEFDNLLAHFKSISKPNIFAPVLLDYKPVKAQQAAVNQVFQQYGQPLMMGLVPDVDKALQTFREQLKKAGVDDLVEYIRTEAYKYFDEKGIQ